MEKRQFLNGIQERRTEAGKLVAGVAAVSNSENFKAPVR
jgi:aromatic amino acid aminotransferase I